MFFAQNTEKYHHKNYHSKRSLVNLGLMCLSAGLFNAFLYSQLDLLHSSFSYLVTILAWPHIQSVGLKNWIYYSRNVSDAAYSNSLIGGLIAVNLGLLYIASKWSRSCYSERNLQHVLEPVHIGTLISYMWERSKCYQVKAGIDRYPGTLKKRIS